VPAEDAACVGLTTAAGYAVVGKANLHEFAFGVTSDNPHFGLVANPLDSSRFAGGSSGGSAAALAGGLADAALGTDSAGSVRIPAACCGVVGFKPTHGRVPTDGVFPLAPSFDVVGPMGRTVADCVALHRALDPTVEPNSMELTDVRVGLAWLDRADPLVRARVDEAASRFTASETIELPGSEAVDNAFRREAANVHRTLWAEHRERYGEDVRMKLERCFAVTDEEYEAAVQARTAYADAWRDAVDGYDVVLTPTVPCVAPPASLGERGVRDQLLRFTDPVSAVGCPALALPCGTAEDGLPASLQIVGQRDADGLVLGVGLGLEADREPELP